MRSIKSTLLIFIFIIFLNDSGVVAEKSSIRVDSTIKGRAKVYLRLSGEERYRQVAGELPATVPVEDGKNYEVMIIKYENFFIKYQGEKKDVHSPETITITTHKEIVWARVVLSAVIPLIVFLEYSRRKKIRLARGLEETLREAEEKVQDAEKRAERSIMENKMPEKIGKYEVLEKVGEGGMACVYKARDASGDIFALKVPHLRYIESEEFMKRFAHEITIGQNLRNQHIVRIYDHNVNIENGIPFICLEFLDGETLGEFRKKSQKVDIRKALSLIRQVTVALEHAHKKGVIHRDIKPSNLVISGKDIVKIMDFGVAKAADLSALTITDTALGTPKYMAPEQIDSKVVDARADLYALGMVLYELLTGRLPFEDEDPYRIVMKKLTLSPASPSDFAAEIPKDIEDMIMKLIKKDPGERYQSASELLTDIDRAIENHSEKNE